MSTRIVYIAVTTKLIEKQSDGGLLVMPHDAIGFKIVNPGLNECGAVQVVSPKELAEKVIEQAKKVIKEQEAEKCQHLR